LAGTSFPCTSFARAISFFNLPSTDELLAASHVFALPQRGDCNTASLFRPAPRRVLTH
jgi:hypothetical protein